METNNILKEDMNIVFVGHVDHGKSTIVGRLLSDTNSLPNGKLEHIKEMCRKNSKPFEYAFLLDALKDERAQGITIDSARCFFKTQKRNYIIIDAPGHIEFLKNMITGAARAEAALLVIDINEGVKENSKRHGYLLSMLGIKQVTVLINKMDLVDYSEEKFNKIVDEYSEFLRVINVKPKSFIPISGINGDNIAAKSDNIKWYKGLTLLEEVDSFIKETSPIYSNFRMPVHDIYNFTKNGDTRRIIVGTVISGKIKKGDELVFYPSGKRSKVKSLETFNAPVPEYFGPGISCGFTLEEQIYITRGEIAVKSSDTTLCVSTKFKCNLFWLGKKSLEKNKKYILKIGTVKVGVSLTDIIRVVDASNLTGLEKDRVERHDVAECIFETDKAIPFDLVSRRQETSRFVIVDDYEISGGGIITDKLDDDKTELRDNIYLRESKWNRSEIDIFERIERLNQKPCLIIITGRKKSDKKQLARLLEKTLFLQGKIVYYLGMGNLKYGVDADIKSDILKREEHIRRLGEVANIMLDAGLILIVTAADLTRDEIEIIKTCIEEKTVKIVWIGDDVSTDIVYDLKFGVEIDDYTVVESIKKDMQESGLIFKP